MSGIGGGEGDECTLSTIDTMHHDTPTQRQQLASEFRMSKPIEPVYDSTDIEFSIENNEQVLTDLYSSELEVAFRLVKADGTVLAAAIKWRALTTSVRQCSNRLTFG